MITRNQFLDRLSTELSRDIQRMSRFVTLSEAGSILIERAKPPRHIYFLTNGFASFMVRAGRGSSQEIGMVGSEGLIGSVGLLGTGISPTECVLQTPATAWQLGMNAACSLFRASAEFRAVSLEFVQIEFSMTARLSACNHLHDAEQRLCRWLLMAADRIGDTLMSITQAELSECLGTQRSTISLNASKLQDEGVIDYKRGLIRILDMLRLRAMACECYAPLRGLISSGVNTGPSLLPAGISMTQSVTNKEAGTLGRIYQFPDRARA